MAVKLNEKYLAGFVSEEEIRKVEKETAEAVQTIKNRNGAGNDFLGWIDLPVNYDKAEFEAIKKAAEKIKKSCDVFVVIGIGGSYLGARAAIEYIKSPLYNALAKDTPDIYFAGNTLSGTALDELLSLCDGKDVCVNVISKSGTTTEPAIAFRVMREYLENKYGKDKLNGSYGNGFIGEVTVPLDSVISLTVEDSVMPGFFKVQKFAEADKTELETAISAAEALDEENYTEESWAAVQEKLDDDKAPTGGRICICTPGYYNKLKLDDAFTKKGDMATQIAMSGLVGEVDGVLVFKAPTSYFPEDVDFVITNPSASPSPVKLQEFKIHDDAPGISGYLVEARVRYDCFVLKQKANAIGVHKPQGE